MSRFVEPLLFPDVAERNGLLVERDPYAPAAMFVRRSVGGPRCAVVVAGQGLIDLTATFQRVLDTCFGRAGGHRG